MWHKPPLPIRSTPPHWCEPSRLPDGLSMVLIHSWLAHGDARSRAVDANAQECANHLRHAESSSRRRGSAIACDMATREHRLSEFDQGPPPLGRPLQLLAEDHNGTYLL